MYSKTDTKIGFLYVNAFENLDCLVHWADSAIGQKDRQMVLLYNHSRMVRERAWLGTSKQRTMFLSSRNQP